MVFNKLTGFLITSSYPILDMVNVVPISLTSTLKSNVGMVDASSLNHTLHSYVDQAQTERWTLSSLNNNGSIKLEIISTFKSDIVLT